jgi:uncharacterized protein YdeI (YjbR/CyaY-like superfamily)
MNTHDTLKDLPVIMFNSPMTWEEWLEVHAAQPAGVWLKIAKKNSKQCSISYTEALEIALCYGWIDGQKRAYDEQFFLQKFTPRRAKSMWSKVNVDKVTALIAQDKMKPGGLLAVAAAKADGRWDQAYDSASTVTIPADFQAALDQNPQAKEFYAVLNKTNTYAILWRIQTTKTPLSRQQKIQTIINMLLEKKKIHP